MNIWQFLQWLIANGGPFTFVASLVVVVGVVAIFAEFAEALGRFGTRDK